MLPSSRSQDRLQIHCMPYKDKVLNEDEYMNNQLLNTSMCLLYVLQYSVLYSEAYFNVFKIYMLNCHV